MVNYQIATCYQNSDRNHWFFCLGERTRAWRERLYGTPREGVNIPEPEGSGIPFVRDLVLRVIYGDARCPLKFQSRTPAVPLDLWLWRKCSHECSYVATLEYLLIPTRSTSVHPQHFQGRTIGGLTLYDRPLADDRGALLREVVAVLAGAAGMALLDGGEAERWDLARGDLDMVEHILREITTSPAERRKIARVCLGEARRLVVTLRPQIMRLTSALIEKKVLDGAEIRKIIDDDDVGPKPVGTTLPLVPGPHGDRRWGVRARVSKAFPSAPPSLTRNEIAARNAGIAVALTAIGTPIRSVTMTLGLQTTNGVGGVHTYGPPARGPADLVRVRFAGSISADHAGGRLPGLGEADDPDIRAALRHLAPDPVERSRLAGSLFADAFILAARKRTGEIEAVKNTLLASPRGVLQSYEAKRLINPRRGA